MEQSTRCRCDDIVCIAGELLQRWERVERETPVAAGTPDGDEELDD